MLAQSPRFARAILRLIGTDDLERLFFWYDREFFRGRLGEMVLEDEAHPVAFRLSRRLVSAAGQTIRQVRRVQQNGKPAVKVDYEITVSTTLLYQHVSKRRADSHGRRPGSAATGSRRCNGSSSTSCCTWPSSWAGAAPIAGPTISMPFRGASSPMKGHFTT